MPAEELTEAQQEELAQELEALRAELTLQLRNSAAGAAPVQLDQSKVGRVSRIDAIHQQRMTQANRSSLKLRLRQSEGALQALAEGSYGLCRACDEPIGYRRLKARPEAPFCVRCQGARDR